MYLKFHRFDPEIGHVPAAGRVGQLRTSEGDRSYSVVINSKGFRGPEPPSRGKHIGIFGDSFVFGYGVDQDHTLPSELSRLTRRSVLNMGICGTAPDQMYLWLRRASRSMKFSMIVLHISPNDFDEVLKSTRYGSSAAHIVKSGGGFEFRNPTRDGLFTEYRYSLEKDTVLFNGEPFSRPWWASFLIAHAIRKRDLSLDNWLERRRSKRFLESFSYLTFKRQFGRRFPRRSEDGPRTPSVRGPGIQRMDWILGEFRKMAESNNFKLVVAYSCQEDRNQHFLSGEYCRDHECISLCRYEKEFEKRHPEIPLNFRYNPHWNEMGHRFFAFVLYSNLFDGAIVG